MISTINGDANTHFYGELVTQQVNASKIPFMALSVGERELRSVERQARRAPGGAELFPIGQVGGKRRIRQNVG